jgi:urease gamma subunit
MTNSSPLTPLGSEAIRDRTIPSVAVRPAGYAAPARFLQLTHPEDLALLSQLASQLLQDPMAVKQLSDRVLELLHQDLVQQQERSHGYGRRR